MSIKMLPALLACLAVGLLTHCGEPEAPSESAPPEAPEVAEEAPPLAEPEAPEPPETEPAAKTEPEPVTTPEATTLPKVSMETSKGTIVLELYPDKAPDTVKNFLQYVDDGFYDSTIFHRVIPGFMIQGGGFTAEMQEKGTRDPIQNEAGSLSNLRYTIAMARTAAPHSASAQFFINHVTNRGLDKDQARDGWGYCVFGKVVEGGEVVNEIAQVDTGNKAGHQNVPTTPVVIRSAKRAG